MCFSCFCPFLSVGLPAVEVINNVLSLRQIILTRRPAWFQHLVLCRSIGLICCLRLNHLKNAGRSLSDWPCLSSHALRHGVRARTSAPQTGKPCGLFDLVWRSAKNAILLPAFWSGLLSLAWFNKYTTLFCCIPNFFKLFNALVFNRSY